MAYLNIENKEDSPEKLAAAAGKPTKHFLFAPEFRTIVNSINTLRHLITLNEGNINIILSNAIKLELGVISGNFIDEINSMEEVALASPIFITYTTDEVFYVKTFVGNDGTYGSSIGSLVVDSDFLPVYSSANPDPSDSSSIFLGVFLEPEDLELEHPNPEQNSIAILWGIDFDKFIIAYYDGYNIGGWSYQDLTPIEPEEPEPATIPTIQQVIEQSDTLTKEFSPGNTASTRFEGGQFEMTGNDGKKMFFQFDKFGRYIPGGGHTYFEFIDPVSNHTITVAAESGIMATREYLYPFLITTTLSIDFSRAKIYYSPSSPATGNITNDLAQAKPGFVQKIYHNHSSAPTFPPGWVKLGGNYVTGALNIIFCEWIESSRVEYWIIQES